MTSTEQNLSIAQRFPLRHLALPRDSFWSYILPEIQMTISNRFTTITDLELERVVTTAFSELAQIICTFSCLENLVLGSIYWHRSDKPPSLLRLPQRLHALELGDENLTEILEWHCSFRQLENLTLRDMCVMSPLRHHCQDINTLLRILGPSLESFRIRLRESTVPYNYITITHLRFLHLNVWRGLEHETSCLMVCVRISFCRTHGSHQRPIRTLQSRPRALFRYIGRHPLHRLLHASLAYSRAQLRRFMGLSPFSVDDVLHQNLPDQTRSDST